MSNKNYFIKDGYIQNDIIETRDSVSDGTYWNKSRINNSRYYQYYVYDYALEIINRKKIKTVMDVGCGVAIKLGMLNSRTENVEFVGIDQGSAIEYCRRTYDWGTWITEDFDRPESCDQSRLADLVICADVIEHLADPDKLLEYLRRVANDNTLIVLSTPERDRLRGRNCVSCPNRSHVREWNFEEIEDYLADRGFSILEHFFQPPVKISLNRPFIEHVILRGLCFRPMNYNQVLLVVPPG